MANAITFPCDPGFIESFAQELEALPPKASAARHNVIRQLLPQIEGMLQKGYTLAEGHARFLLKGIACSFETFRRHVRKAQAQRDGQREYQGTGTAVENTISTFENQAASVVLPVSPTPDDLSQSAVHPAALFQVATEARSEMQSIAELAVIASTDVSPVESKEHPPVQETSQLRLEPQTLDVVLTTATEMNLPAIEPMAMDRNNSTVVMENEGHSQALSDRSPDPEQRCPAFTTPRRSREEMQTFYNQY
jgi:hypothetical protein